MSDVVATIQYIAAVQLLGLAALPLSLRLFNKLPDRGWALSKILGILLSAWSVWLLSSLKLVPFDRISSLIIIGSIATIIWLLFFRKELIRQLKAAFWFIVIEEILFIGFIAFWTYLRGWSPDINGLEKFMDYGFMLSAMKTEYFPPIDHFLARESINYYYFGHYIAGFITMIANVPASMGYNLQMSLIFGLAVIESFAIGAGLFYLSVKEELIRVPWRSWLAGTLSFLFITLFGNLHTAVYYFIDRTTYWYPDATRFIENTIHEFPIYSFIVNDLHGHVSDIPVVFLVIATLLMVLLLPFEKRKFIVNEPKSIANRRLLYLFFLSFVIGTMYATNAWDYAIYLVLSGCLLWTTNALSSSETNIFNKFFAIPTLIQTAFESVFLLILSIVFYVPFWLNLVPISDGIGIVPFGSQSPLWQLIILWGVMVPLALMLFFWLSARIIEGTSRYWLANFKAIIYISISVTLGFILLLNLLGVGVNSLILLLLWLIFAIAFSFWSVSKSIKSPQHTLLQSVITSLAGIFKLEVSFQNSHTVSHTKTDLNWNNPIQIGTVSIDRIHLFTLLLVIVSSILIILPEFIFIRDIYPTHYRANTMFKFYYQAWIMLGLVIGYGVVIMWHWYNKEGKSRAIPFRILSAALFAGALMYPINAIEQGFGGFAGPRRSIDGTQYLATRHPGDYKAINWINENLEDQPTILEAVGDSYTDYARIAANTGNPTVLGWPVHEWLWRGSYTEALKPETEVQKRTGETDTVAQRVEDVRIFYETDDPLSASEILDKHQVNYVYLGQLERDKYPSINTEKLADMNISLVYDDTNVQIYKVR